MLRTRGVAYVALALEAVAAMAAAPTTRPATTQAGWPVVYAALSKPQALSEPQVREIRAWVDAANDAERSHGKRPRDVWFVLVRYITDGQFRAVVYLMPDESRGRARHGRSLWVDSDFSIEKSRQLARELKEPWPTLNPYAQVTSAAAKDRGAGAPAIADLPFEETAGLSDDEVVAAIDAARRELAPLEEGGPGDVKLDPMPVQSIMNQKDGTFEIWFGWQVGPLWGGGEFVTVERDGKGFKAKGGVGHWVS
jgi:hypothetical protein